MKPKSTNTFAVLGAAMLIVFVTAPIASAFALTWDADSLTEDAQDGSGTWTTGAGNWRDTTTPADNVNWADSDTATFGAGVDGTYTITLDTVTLGGPIPIITSGVITFANSGYTLEAASAETISGSGNITVASGKSATIGTNVTLTRSAAYTVSGGGTLNVTGAGATLTSSTGNTTVSGSKVSVGTDGIFSGNGSIVIGGTTSAAELEVNGGAVSLSTTSGANLILANGTSGSATITLSAGSITNNLIGGTLRFGTTGANTAISTFNLDGGTLTVGKVFEGNAGHSSTFNFNGGTLKVLATSTNLATFMTGIDTANVRDGGAKIDTSGVTVTFGQNLVHSTIGGDAATDGGLTKNGSGTLTVGGTNTYTGPTTINAGTLSAANIVVSGGSSNLGDASSPVVLGSAGSLGILSYSGGDATYTRGFMIGGAGGGRLTVATSTTTLDVDTGNITGTGLFTVGGAGRTRINSAITHTGGVTKVTTGSALILANGSNSYDGVTTVQNSGAIVVTANGALGATSAGTVVSSGASLALSGGIDYSNLETVTGSGNGSGVVTGDIPVLSRGFIQSTSGSNTFRGDIVIDAAGATRIGTQDGASLTLTGTITQATGSILFRVGNGPLLPTPNAGGDFVTLSNAGNSFGADSTIFTAAVTGYSGVRLGIANALPTNLTISGLEGETPTAAGTALDLNGFDQTLNGLIGTAPLNIINTNTGTPSTLTLNPTADQITTGTVIAGGTGLSGPLGTINLVKEGDFTQTLEGANTHTGTTAVNAGSLLVNGDSSGATGAVSVNNAATLGGTGTIGGSVTVAVAANLAPGASAGTLTINGNLDLSAMAAGSGQLEYELDALAATNDLIAVGGSLNLGSLALDDLAITNLGGLEPGTYTLITSTGLSGTVSGASASIAAGLNGQLQITGNNLELVVTAASGGFAAWQSANFTAGGLDEDHDNDGVDNGVEWFLGGNNDTTGFTTPLPGVVGNTVTWVRHPDYPGFPGNYGTDFVVETSTTLVNPWTPATEGVGAGFVEITGNNVKYTFPAGTKNFARLKITGP